MSYYKTEKFKKLQKKWYEKLKKEGFEDAETNKDDSWLLRSWDSFYFQSRYTPDTFEHKQLYYEGLRDFLHKHEFESKRERTIWEMHSEGIGIRHISADLKIKCWVVHETIKKLHEVMKRGKRNV